MQEEFFKKLCVRAENVQQGFFFKNMTTKVNSTDNSRVGNIVSTLTIAEHICQYYLLVYDLFLLQPEIQ